jgi:two-component system, OmpR family, phosphate regulon response regulator PhoB
MNKKYLKIILVIEDHPDIQQLIKMTMSFENYEVHQASDVQVGLKMVDALKPDLIILDVMLPPRLEIGVPDINNGLDLCRYLKTHSAYSSIPIILLTARGQETDKEAGLNAGADEYLVKPFSPMKLIELTNSLTRRV